MKWIILALAILGLSEAKSYDNYKVFRTSKLSLEQAQELRKWDDVYDFWRPARSGIETDIMASPNEEKFLLNKLANLGINSWVHIENVGELIKTQKVGQEKSFDGKISFDQYYSHSDLNAYLDEVEKQFDFVKVVNIGKSHEGRDMKVLQITKAGEGKPNIWIEAGIHAREWISPAMATYIIDSLLNHDENNFVDQLNFHILPSANPDGYEHSRGNDRLWRKTRSDYGSVLLCKGVDGNRNWDFHFAESGASNSKCSDTYHGPEPFSEVEMQHIRDYTLSLDPVPVLAQCLHSYSQLWLWPYGYAYNAYPDNYLEIKELAEEAVKALEAVHGTVFDPINSAQLYPAAGASDDWYKGVLGSRFSYTTELRDTGRYGFVLPANQIKPSGEELWAAQTVMFKKMIEVSKE